MHHNFPVLGLTKICSEFPELLNGDSWADMTELTGIFLQRLLQKCTKNILKQKQQ